ncbi:MAG: hypothetical protein V7L21_05065 [Nostoc sp.]|uniref:hypothetical protein n=1 Tax=Nostoc sp. TaxID=1180 RepID=UPI002FFCBD59
MQGQELLQSLLQATSETFYMVGISTLVAIVLGLPLGLLLVMTDPGNLLDFPKVHKVLGAIVNTGQLLALPSVAQPL